METLDFKPIVRNVKNNCLYEFVGGTKFRNLITGIEGDVPEEKAKEVFRINVEATALINEFPEIKNLIKSLNLRCDGVVGMSE